MSINLIKALLPYRPWGNRGNRLMGINGKKKGLVSGVCLAALLLALWCPAALSGQTPYQTIERKAANAGCVFDENALSKATICQTSDFSEAVIDQIGVGLKALVEQSGDVLGKADITQSGTDLEAGIIQHGWKNRAGIEQSGSSSCSAGIDQEGSENLAAVVQRGSALSAMIHQFGANNQATIHQGGELATALINQNGLGNYALINQSDLGNAAYIDQIGNGHSADIHQSDHANHAQILQDSSVPSSVSIVQRGGDNYARVEDHAGGRQPAIIQEGMTRVTVIIRR